MPTPLQWLSRLESMLENQRAHGRLYDAYYSGERRLELLERDYAEVFGADNYKRPLLNAPYSNVAAIGIDALAERVSVEGFRVGADDDARGAAAADALWQGNDLDAVAPIGHVESFVKGTAAALVWPGRDGRAVISVEDAEQLVVHRSSSPPYDVDAALKLYIDEWTAESVALLWLRGDGQSDGGRYTYRKLAGGALQQWPDLPTPTTWDYPTAVDKIERLPEAFDGRVPVVELANRQRLLRPPASELVHVAPLADVHDKLIGDLVIAASFGAIPIRTATGIKLKRVVNAATGETELVSPFDVRADRAMVSEDPNARFGTLPASDLAGYVAAIDMVLREIRALTRTPQHYYGEGVAAGMSGETLKAAEASLVRKVGGILPRFGATWRKVVSLGLALDSPEFARAQVETRWRNTETQVEAQAVDAAQKLEAMGVPLEIVLERLGFPRPLIARAVSLRNAEQLRGQRLVELIRRDTIDPTDPTPTPTTVPAVAA